MSIMKTILAEPGILLMPGSLIVSWYLMQSALMSLTISSGAWLRNIATFYWVWAIKNTFINSRPDAGVLSFGCIVLSCVWNFIQGGDALPSRNGALIGSVLVVLNFLVPFFMVGKGLFLNFGKTMHNTSRRFKKSVLHAKVFWLYCAFSIIFWQICVAIVYYTF
eukprot:m.1128275 g.1128275  ORF g.1128275 m.1128275 type:complete len:164 (-) comp24413_c0_seq20:3595-4086(-)